MHAYEQLFLGRPFVDLADIEADWQRPSYDIASATTGVFEEERMIGYADVSGRRAEVYVHPDWHGQGLGSALAEWTEQVARRDRASAPDATADRLIGQTVPVTDTAALALFAARGYTLRHTSWVLRLPDDVKLAPVPLPPGVVIRPGERSEDRAAWRVVEDAFNEWPNREGSSFEDWAAEVVHRPGFEPWQMLVAVDDETVVGVCFVILADREAWVYQLAVRRDYRNLGLGRALLSEAGRLSREHGAQVLELNTDSRTGALGLYEHIGMVVTDTFEHWALSTEAVPD
jgi:mycothiol synthase